MKNYNGVIKANYYHCSFSFRLNDKAKCYNKFGEEKNNLHYGLWHMILNHFKKRGFLISEDPNTKGTCISGDNKCGIKNGLEFYTHRYPMGFSFEFFQNVTESENKNGGRYDFNKYFKFPYRLKLSLKNEINKVLDYCKSKGIESTIDGLKPKTPEQKIIDDNANNPHIHGKIMCLSELQGLMKHNLGDNSSDKNKKQIINGETKWFYCTYSRRLLRGVVYHNINNMWWVLMNDSEIRNISSFSLFDYTPGMPFRLELTKQEKINRLNIELNKHSKSQNYEKCIKIRNLINKLADQPTYKIYSLKHSCWWRANNSGYTNDEKEAGLYLKENVLKNQEYYNNGHSTKAVPVI